MSPTAQFLVFIVGFILVLSAFITFIVILAKRLNGTLPARRHGRIEAVTIAGIFLGIIMMFQQVTLSLFEPGFLVLLFSLLAFIAWSHVTPKQAPRAHEAGGPEIAEH
jgi:hypothetical protein